MVRKFFYRVLVDKIGQRSKSWEDVLVDDDFEVRSCTDSLTVAARLGDLTIGVFRSQGTSPTKTDIGAPCSSTT